MNCFPLLALDPESPNVNQIDYSDDYLRRILASARTIAVVGASTNWNRPSYFAMKYMQSKGYRMIPVNPTAVGQEILGEKVYADLRDISERVDIVDIFRKPEDVPPLVERAIEIGAKVVWMQLGVVHHEAAKRAQEAGLDVVMNRCVKLEYGRLTGELSWGGVNSGVITSKRNRSLRR